MRRVEVPPRSRQRVDSRCRTVAAPPTLGPAADVSRGTIVPSSPADPAVLVRSPGRAHRSTPPRCGPGSNAAAGSSPATQRHLTRLDAVLGDGDHGDNLVIGLRAVDELLAELPPNTPPGEILQAVGHRLVAAVGGASGSALRHGLHRGRVRGRAVETWSTDRRSPRCSDAAAAGLARRGRCQPGDKTILDTLAPAADAFAARDRCGRCRSPTPTRAARPGRARGHALDARPRRPARPRPPTGRAIRRPPRPGRGLVPAPALSRWEADERPSRPRWLGSRRSSGRVAGPSTTPSAKPTRCSRSTSSASSSRRAGSLDEPRAVGGPRGRPPGGGRRRGAVARRARRARAWRCGVGRDAAVPDAASRRPLDGLGRGPASGAAASPGRARRRRRRRAAGRSCSGSGPPTVAAPDPDGIRVVQLARHELAVAFRSARLREALERERSELTAVVDGTTDLILQVDARAAGRPAQPGRRAAARRRRRPTRSAGRAPRCSAARSPAGTIRRPARSPRSWRPASRSPTARPRSAGADGSSIRVAGGYSAVARAGPTAGDAPGSGAGDRDRPRHQRGPRPRGAARGVRRDRQPRTAHAAVAHPRLRRDAPPSRPRRRRSSATISNGSTR